MTPLTFRRLGRPLRSPGVLASMILALLPNFLITAFAADSPKQPDVIIFKNGDRLTGKFIRAIKGTATFHSNVAGDVSISWNDIKEIQLASKFVTVPPKTPPKAAAQPVEVTVVEGPNAQPSTVSSAEYLIDQAAYDRATQHKLSMISGWTGTATAGATIVAATQNSYTFNGGVALARTAPVVQWLDPRDRTLVDFSGSFGKITEPTLPEVKTAIYHADAERDEYLSPRFYALAQTAFDHNFSQSLDLQQIYGGGIGRTILKKPIQTLDFKASIQYEHQAFLEAAAGSDLSLIGSTFAAAYMRKLPKGIIFNQQAAYIPAWNNMHAYSVTEADALQLPVFKRFSFAVGTLDSYLNDPAVTVPSTKRNSLQFTMGLSYTLPAPH